MATIPSFAEPQLQAIADVLGDTGSGLSGSEIGSLLGQCKIADPHPGITKRHRLYEALSQRQHRDQCGNNVVAFIQHAMSPVRYHNDPKMFQSRREHLNRVLIYAGLKLREDGQLESVAAARTIHEAEERAGQLRAELRRRKVHPDVLAFCRSELLQDGNYFHAVLEATKSVADKIRQRTGLGTDGYELVDQAFGVGKAGMPYLAFNSLQTESERSEHTGLMNIMKGLFGTFRNPTAHAPKVSWRMDADDALDLLSMASFVHRRLDAAMRTPRVGP